MSDRAVHRWLVGVALLSLGACSADGGGGLDDDVGGALGDLPGATVEDSRDGVPTFVSGDLGRASGGKVDAADAGSTLPALLAKIAPVFKLRATDLKLIGTTSDADGTLHARYRQLQYGFDVAGAELILHIDRQGVVYAVNGTARGAGDPSMATTVTAGAAVERLLGSQAYRGMGAGEPRLAFVLDGARSLRLAWEVRVEGDRDGEPVDDRVFVDARSGAIVAAFPQIHAGKKRTIVTASNAQLLPGQERMTEGQMAHGDPMVGTLYDHLGIAYDCYQTLFKRDSFDGKGGAITGVIHYGTNLNNAYHQGNGVVVFGDGDGRNFGPFARSLDVVAHELTHGVTGATANLEYANESGALNESMSDVFGTVCESWYRGGPIDAETWKLATEIYTPATPGDAMRYMDNPTADGDSTDYYPERYLGGGDNGGVHFNSGISNLAFKLLVTGGKHPRGKTAITVPGLGMTKASQIYYRALTTYLTSLSQFSDARAATMFAAKELYGDEARDAVAAAWSAVGVEAPGVTPATGPFTLLTGGVDTAISDKEDGQKLFAIDVPEGAGQLVVETRGGTGDVDLFVARGTAPAPYRADHGSANLGMNGERISVASPAAGRWFILASAIADYDGATLQARVVGGAAAPESLPIGVWQTVGGGKGAARNFFIDVPAGVGWLAVELDSGKGDADLFIKRAGAPTTSSFDVSSATAGSGVEKLMLEPTAGKYHVLVQGRDDFQTVALRATLLGPTALASGASVDVAGGGGLAAVYKIDVPAGTTVLEAALHGTMGDADVYVRAGQPPTDLGFDAASRGPTSDELVRISHPAAGATYIAVYGSGKFSGAQLRVTASKDALPAPALVNNAAATLKLGASETGRFTFEVPPTATDGTFRFSGADGTLIVKHGTDAWADAKQVALVPIAAGAYDLALTPSAALSGWIRAAIHSYPSLRDGRIIYLSGGPASKKVLKLDLPADAKGVTITLSGGLGDADLYLKKGGVPTPDSNDAASEQQGNAESVTLASGAGTYYLLVVGYEDYALAEVKTTVSK